MSTRPSGHCGLWALWSRHWSCWSQRPAFWRWVRCALLMAAWGRHCSLGQNSPSACGQLEGRLGTQNDRGHSASPFILPWDPMGPPRSWRPSLPSAARPFEPVQEFQGLSGPYITFTALFPLLILPSSGGKNVVSQFAQTTNSVVKMVNNERERGSVGVHSKRTGAKTEKKIEKEKLW